MRELKLQSTVAVKTVRNQRKCVIIKSIVVTSNNINFLREHKNENEKQHYTRRYLILYYNKNILRLEIYTYDW